MIFGSVRFAIFVKSLKTVRFLERYGSRHKILIENGNEICTVRFVLTKKRSTVGYLARYGSPLKTETENGVTVPHGNQLIQREPYRKNL